MDKRFGNVGLETEFLLVVGTRPEEDEQTHVFEHVFEHEEHVGRWFFRAFTMELHDNHMVLEHLR